MGAVLDELLVVQGSDDWLFSRAAERFQESVQVPVVATHVGSLGGLAALAAGRAHLAGCHVDNAQAQEATGEQACYLVTLFQRSQGLIFDGTRHPGVTGMRDLVWEGLRFAERQPLSGTYRLSRRLLAEAGIDTEGYVPVGPFSSHLELALAIREGTADAGVGTRLAARMCGLAFVDLATEAFKLAVPLAFAGHPRIAAFLDFLERDLEQQAARGVSGYDFAPLGRMETLGNGTDPVIERRRCRK